MIAKKAGFLFVCCGFFWGGCLGVVFGGFLWGGVGGGVLGGVFFVGVWGGWVGKRLGPRLSTGTRQRSMGGSAPELHN